MFDDLIIEPANESFKDVINNIIEWFKKKIEWIQNKIKEIGDKMAKSKLGQLLTKLKDKFKKAKNAKTADEAIEAQEEGKEIVSEVSNIVNTVENSTAKTQSYNKKSVFGDNNHVATQTAVNNQASKEEPKKKESKKANSIKRDPNNYGMHNKWMTSKIKSTSSPKQYGENLMRRKAAEEAMIEFADWCDDMMIVNE